MAENLVSQSSFGGSNNYNLFSVISGETGTVPVATLNRVRGATPDKHPNKGAVVLDIDALQMNQELWDFFEANITTASTDVVEEMLEDGSKVSFSQAEGTVPANVMIYSLPKLPEETTVRTFVALMIVTGETGSIRTQAGGFAETPAQFTSIVNPSLITVTAETFTACGLTKADTALPANSTGMWINTTPVS